ncbi:hypothetical protein [Methylocystis heyeri]|uniref:Uncharacterized protein n=1 Tax=Methylocystis heyeri TaxID=391905 RepID=A0A6B8KIE1_9HYPH|nr:hypothetical protein [Methylocystis heyeri]QGM46811.1 hypothetical protein H2LOC_014520 [Methylocystis heyeri]
MRKNFEKNIFGVTAATLLAAVCGTGTAQSQEAITGAPLDVSSVRGGPASAGAARQVILRDLPTITAANPGPVKKAWRPKTVFSASQLAAIKAQAALPGANPAATTLSGEPTPPSDGITPNTPGASISFEGDAEFELCSGWTPADQALAVGDGPSPVLQGVNQCLSVWSISGSRLLGPKNLYDFFNLPSGTFMSDPRALYDFYNHRFIVTALDSDSGNSNNYDIAVSASDDPTGGWYTWRLSVPSASRALPDYPRVGQDRAATYPIGSGTAYPGAIYLASNLFSNDTGHFLNEEWLILPKAAMYNGQGFSFWYIFNTQWDGHPTDTTQPVNVWSPYDNPRAEYLIGSRNFFCSSGCNGLAVWAISNPFGFVSGGPSPELSAYVLGTGNNYSQPPNATQPGGANTIDSGDLRISGEATYLSGSIYAAIAPSNGAGGVQSILYRVQPSLNANDSRCTGSYTNLCPQVTGARMLNETVLNYGGTKSAFYPVQQPDLEGNVTTVFSYSTTAYYPSLAYISQRASQTPATFADNGIFLATGQAYYSQGRWGDYNAVAPAGVAYLPGDGHVPVTPGMAFSGMYAGGSNNWRTRIGYSKFTSAAQP